jgi:PBSX family phage terminase large subunit
MNDAKLFGTSNPGGSNHWLKKLYLDRASTWLTGDGPKKTIADPIDLTRFSFRLNDNPFLSEEYVSALAKEYVGLWYKRYIEGLWVIAEGAIYDMWDEERHVVDYASSGGIQVIGIDYGTTNPFACEAIEISPSKSIQVFSELGITEPYTDSQLADEMERWIAEQQIVAQWICVDPSAASFKMELYRRGFSNLVDANNSVADGLRMAAALLSQGRMTVSPKCEKLCAEIPDYRWDPDYSAKGVDKPIKRDDHHCDGLRYAIATTESLWRT